MLEDRIRRIAGGSDADVDCELRLRVGKPEGGRQAIIEASLDALDGPNYRDMGDVAIL